MKTTLAAIVALAGSATARLIPITAAILPATSTSSSSETEVTPAPSWEKRQSTQEPCAVVSSSIAAYSSIASNAGGSLHLAPSVAMACLESVALDADRSLAFVEYITPYLQFHTNHAYLKNPPQGYPMDGADIFGGLEQISANLQSRAYDNQWAFEKDLYTLVNILPHDFHLNLPLPLVGIFGFGIPLHLVSVSLDGNSLPQPYVLDDLQAAQSASSNTSLGWIPSSIASINNSPATDYLLGIAIQSQQYQDPDAAYNRLFSSIPLGQSGANPAFFSGGYPSGLASDTTAVLFTNGTTQTFDNFAIALGDFTGVDSGAALFSKFELPVTSTAEAVAARDTPTTTTSVAGYPTPIILHPNGYTGGYYLDNSDTAVLAINAFESADADVASNTEQQAIISSFLASCKTDGKTKLIVDLQGNQGGSVYNGYDAFKQLFPSVDLLGATRYRVTPLVQYFSEIFTTAAKTNSEFDTLIYTEELQDNINRQSFANVQDMIGPYPIYGDNFTALMRDNLTYQAEQKANGVLVSGYSNSPALPAQVFSSANIVILHDGACGSTCAVFAELMKSQGAVRSIAVGGRPKTGAMQGVGGTKGAQVYAYSDVQGSMTDVQAAAEEYHNNGIPFPPLNVSAEFNVSSAAPPLGTSLGSTARFNLRNNFNSDDPAAFPLQFVYEAANCRLFYQAQDLFEIEGLWERVADTTWGNGKCVPGSSVISDSSIPNVATDTVAFTPATLSRITLSPMTLGIVVNTGNGPIDGS